MLQINAAPGHNPGDDFRQIMLLGDGLNDTIFGRTAHPCPSSDRLFNAKKKFFLLIAVSHCCDGYVRRGPSG